MRYNVLLGLVASLSIVLARPTFVKNGGLAGGGRRSGSSTNGERFVNGLPPLPPKSSEDADKRGLRQAGIFNLPSTSTGIRGKIKVIRTDTGKSLGYISRRLNYHYGWFSPTKNPNDFLIVTIPESYQRGSGATTLVSLENMKPSNPPCLTCQYLALTQHNVYGNVGVGRPAYLWVTAGEETSTGGGPQNVANSRGGGGMGYASASSVWTVEADGTLVPHWLNYEATERIHITGAFNRALGSELLFTGDYAAFHKFGEQGATRPGPNTPAVPMNFVFVAAA